MAEAITQAIAWLIAWAASVGLDAFIGKWVAYFTIAWENHASERARLAFKAAVKDLKLKAKAKAEQGDAREAWRQSVKKDEPKTP